jgi:hypothetical protein
VTQAEALALTLVVEVPVVLACVAVMRCRARRDGATSDAPPGALLPAALAAFGASLVTHPLAWAADRALDETVPLVLRWSSIEAAVVAAEAFVYAKPLGLGLRRGAIVSTVANAASFLVGRAVAWPA